MRLLAAILLAALLIGCGSVSSDEAVENSPAALPAASLEGVDPWGHHFPDQPVSMFTVEAASAPDATFVPVWMGFLDGDVACADGAMHQEMKQQFQGETSAIFYRIDSYYRISLIPYDPGASFKAVSCPVG